ncbi:MAG TPA: hypothetical protein VKX49_14625 [Bryobacteraceae bacterium]|nr:hypothetical protein [Bryobacteraceae bacterium]
MSTYVPIEGALGAVKTGFELIKSVRELLKKEKVDPVEVNNQLLQIQELLLETRNAVTDARAYIEKLDAELANKRKSDEVEKLMVYDQTVYWKRTGNGDEIEPHPYCTVCWEKERQLSHLRPGASKGTWRCQIDGTSYLTKDYEARTAQPLRPLRMRSDYL